MHMHGIAAAYRCGVACISDRLQPTPHARPLSAAASPSHSDAAVPRDWRCFATQLCCTLAPDQCTGPQTETREPSAQPCIPCIITTTCLVLQGRTSRWGLAWSFQAPTATAQIPLYPGRCGHSPLCTIRIGPSLQLKALLPGHAAKLFALIDESREYLGEWLAWVDETTDTSHSAWLHLCSTGA